MIPHEVNQPLAAIQFNAQAALNLLGSPHPTLGEIAKWCSTFAETAGVLTR